MLVNNEFLTLRVFQNKFTLETASIAIELKRNNLYYYNEFGIIIEIFPTRADESNENPTLYLWYPAYRAVTSHETGDVVSINGDDHTVVVGNLFQTIISDIELFSNSANTDREKRTYENLSVIRIYQIDANNDTLAWNATRTKVLEIKLPINTTPLPTPYLKAFDLDMITADTARISWKGTNPGDFYYYELWDSWNPIEPLYKQRINTATGQYFHTFGAVAKGKYNIFTLKIVRDGITYAERQIKILLPRDDFNIFSRSDGENYSIRNPLRPSDGLKYTDAIYIISRDDNDALVKTPVAFVWFKAGNQWYTD